MLKHLFVLLLMCATHCASVSVNRIEFKDFSFEPSSSLPRYLISSFSLTMQFDSASTRCGNVSQIPISFITSVGNVDSDAFGPLECNQDATFVTIAQGYRGEFRLPSLDFSNFPIDEHVITIAIVTQSPLSTATPQMSMSGNFQLQGWTLLEPAFSVDGYTHPVTQQQMSSMSFGWRVRRVSSSFVSQIGLPLVGLSALSWVCFLLPLGDNFASIRVGAPLLVLLIMFAIRIVAVSSAPPVSYSTTFDAFFLFGLSVASVSVVWNAILIRLHAASEIGGISAIRVVEVAGVVGLPLTSIAFLAWLMHLIPGQRTLLVPIIAVFGSLSHFFILGIFWHFNGRESRGTAPTDFDARKNSIRDTGSNSNRQRRLLAQRKKIYLETSTVANGYYVYFFGLFLFLRFQNKYKNKQNPNHGEDGELALFPSENFSSSLAPPTRPEPALSLYSPPSSPLPAASVIIAPSPIPHDIDNSVEITQKSAPQFSKNLWASRVRAGAVENSYFPASSMLVPPPPSALASRHKIVNVAELLQREGETIAM